MQVGKQRSAKVDDRHKHNRRRHIGHHFTELSLGSNALEQGGILYGIKKLIRLPHEEACVLGKLKYMQRKKWALLATLCTGQHNVELAAASICVCAAKVSKLMAKSPWMVTCGTKAGAPNSGANWVTSAVSSAS